MGTADYGRCCYPVRDLPKPQGGWMTASRKARLPVVLVLCVVGASACKKGGKDTGPIAPDPALGAATSIALCGTTTQQFDPGCRPAPANTIDLRWSTGNSPLACPCFTFTLLNLNQSDLGTAISNTYGV